MGSRAGVHPYVMQRLLKQAPAYNIERLRRAYRRLLEADLSIKRGIYDDETAIHLLITELAAMANARPSAGVR
jgi:DNA polymerase III delta subunit